MPTSSHPTADVTKIQIGRSEITDPRIQAKGTASPVELAGEILTVLVDAVPDRGIHAVGDATYRGTPLLLPDTTITTLELGFGRYDTPTEMVIEGRARSLL